MTLDQEKQLVNSVCAGLQIIGFLLIIVSLLEIVNTLTGA